MNKTFSRDEVIDMAAAVMKAIRSQVDLDQEQLDMCTDVISRTVVQTLLDSGAQLPWIRNIRRNCRWHSH